MQEIVPESNLLYFIGIIDEAGFYGSLYLEGGVYCEYVNWSRSI